MTATPRPRRTGATGSLLPIFILSAIAAGAALLALAMFFYPGGTAMNRAAPGHSFWLNFLCDLTSPRAVNGRPNPVSAHFARAGLMCLCMALGLFWTILPRSFGARGDRRVGLAITVLGLFSVVGLLLVPIVDGWFHVAAVFASSLPALVAGVLALIETVRYARALPLVIIASATISAATLDSVLYGLSFMARPRVISPALPFFQRVALLLMISWMATVAVRTLSRRRRFSPSMATARNRPRPQDLRFPAAPPFVRVPEASDHAGTKR